MMIFKKAIPRRAFLRGMGATVALPLLDSMVPAFAGTLDVSKPKVRLSVAYCPNGIIMENWTPKTDGAGFQLMPTMEPLAPFRDRLLVLTGLEDAPAWKLAGEGGGAHAGGSAPFLTGAHPYPTEGVAHMATSMDQIVAKELGKETQLGSLELAIDRGDLVGSCDIAYTCAYVNTLSWRTPTTPLPMENQPREVFNRLFGDRDSTDPAKRLARLQKDRSILDSVTEGVSRLLRGLGQSDRAKFSEWLDAIRDVERRIQLAEEQGTRELPTLDRPAGVPATFEDHAKLMFDLQVLAFQADLTRVITFMLGREKTERAYPEIGVPDAHHPITHHGGNPELIAKVTKINTHHVKMFSYFLEKLQSTRDGDGSLLDHSVLLYGAGISNGNAHAHDNLPILLAGGGAGKLKGGRHIRYPEKTPFQNLNVALLNIMGTPVEKHGDSTGKLEL